MPDDITGATESEGFVPGQDGPDLIDMGYLPGELRQRPGDQPLPVPNDSPDIQSMVIGDIARRRQLGISRYGTALQPHNGRDALRDLYEELVDSVMYVRQVIAERDGVSPADVRERIIRALDEWGCQVSERQADAVMAVVEEVLREARMNTRTRTEYAVAWGGGDPNDCAGLLTYDDEDEAARMTQWISGSYVAGREVTRGRWERAGEAGPGGDAPARAHSQEMAGEQPPAHTWPRVRHSETLSGDPGDAEGETP